LPLSLSLELPLFLSLTQRNNASWQVLKELQIRILRNQSQHYDDNAKTNIAIAPNTPGSSSRGTSVNGPAPSPRDVAWSDMFQEVLLVLWLNLLSLLSALSGRVMAAVKVLFEYFPF